MLQFLRPVRRVLCVAAFLAVLSPSVASAATEPFRPPTDAPVLDPFRLPDGQYGAGNRGIEYDTIDGDLIRSAAAGEVVFSGAVAGSLFVSIEHPGGLRSTYGFVSNLLARVGTRVDAGDVVARAAGPFHFTVRIDGIYVDPAGLFGSLLRRVTLVSDRSRPWPAEDNVLSLAGLEQPPGTLLGGPSGPRTVPNRPRRILLVRATPGRFGVLHGLKTGKKEHSWQSSR
jgi:murein DD-endopeptidase MepM/ murein hydrolase activator NlpD